MIRTSNMLKGFPAVAVALIALPAAAEEPAKAGLPQLDFSLYPEQLFWLVLSFGLLYLLMRHVALPGVEKTQGNRKAIIDGELATAKKANEEARAMGMRAEQALADARSKSTVAINDIKNKSAAQAAEQKNAQSQQLSQRLREAEGKISTARSQAMTEIEATAKDMASMIAEKVTGLKVRV